MSACPTTSPVHVLHTHSTMSILDGASSVSAYLEHCKKHGLGGCGITDHGWLVGLHELITTAPKFGVKPIPGVEFYLMARPDHVPNGEPLKYYHMTVWAKNQVGYKNLSILASRSWGAERTVMLAFGRRVPRITFDDLMMYNEGLIIGSGCIEGPFGKSLLRNEPAEAIKNLAMLWDVFKGRMFFEIIPHQVRDDFVSKNMVVGHYTDPMGCARELKFNGKDMLTLADGTQLEASAIAGSNQARAIVAANPIRVQGDLLEDALGAIGLCHTAAYDPSFAPARSQSGIWVERWELRNGTFIGNECTSVCRDGCMQKAVNEQIIRTAHQLKAPLLITLDAHFVRPETKAVQDILLQNGNKDGWRFSTTYYQMNTEQAWEQWEKYHAGLFRSTQAFQEGVENNQAFVDMVEEIKFPKAYHLPEIEFPVEITTTIEDRNARLLRLVAERIAHHGRMPTDERLPIYMERLRRELSVIAGNPTINFLPYFLIIDLEITSYMRSLGRLVGPGRGSAAGCLLSYLLGITHVDPIMWNLSFERFLSLGRIARGKFPDIDLDFGDPKLVVEHLYAKYGERFARISTTGTMKLKGAIRDVCRILMDTKNNEPARTMVDQLCLTIDNTPQGMDDRKWLYGYEDTDGIPHAGYITENEALAQFFVRFPQVKEMVDEVLSVPRSVGRHASAYCLSDIPISEIVPMCLVNDEPCTQFTMGPVEKLGLIKMDFLGLNTLNDIGSAVELIEKRHGIKIDIYNLPLDDEKCFKAFCQGRTETVFQFKTALSRDLCIKIQPKSIEDLAAITANGRPGTMYAELEDGTKLIDAWVARRQGKMPVVYVHPDLEEILKVTDGIFTYQEQVMATFTKCCGWTEERADEVREIIGKKQHDKMEVLIPEIRNSLLARGWTGPQAETFISLCKAASSYSFNRSHSVAYAYIGYVCQWLKCNYPLEWWASVLNNGSHKDLEESAQHVRDYVVPPDVNASDTEFYIIDEGRGKIVFPLNRVKQVGKAGEAISKLKPFESFADFYQRVERRMINKRVVMALIFSGAFDQLCDAQNIQDRLRIAQIYYDLRGDKMNPELQQADEADLMRFEDEYLAIGDADFTTFLIRKTRKQMLSPSQFRQGFGRQWHENDNVRIGGIVRRVSKTQTKKDKKPMAFMDVGNQSEITPVTVFPREYETYKSLLKEDELIVVEGRVNTFGGKLSIVAEGISVYRDKAKLADFTEET